MGSCSDRLVADDGDNDADDDHQLSEEQAFDGLCCRDHRKEVRPCNDARDDSDVFEGCPYEHASEADGHDQDDHNQYPLDDIHRFLLTFLRSRTGHEESDHTDGNQAGTADPRVFHYPLAL